MDPARIVGSLLQSISERVIPAWFYDKNNYTIIFPTFPGVAGRNKTRDRGLCLKVVNGLNQL